jgi:oligoribonuclease NrnB/cAMP/cGMP phosphodiesterase (DHH superfamily)
MNLIGVREIGKAACELSWNYFFSSESMPKIVRMLGHYDVWNFTQYSEDELNNLQLGLRTEKIDPDNFHWVDLFYNENLLSHILLKGGNIRNYRKNTYADFSRDNAYRFTWNGYKVVAANTSNNPNHTLESIITIDDDLFVTYVFNGNKWVISLRTHQDNDIDVSIIAKKYGGGGHKKAAGFSCNRLPSEFLKIGN